MRAILLAALAALLFCLPRPTLAQTCTVSAPAVYFGNLGSPVPHTDVPTTVSVSCAGGAANSTLRVCIGITPANFIGVLERTMFNGFNSLGYEIYSNTSHSAVWDAGSRIAVLVSIGSSGSGSSTTTMYAHLPAPGNNPPIGMYKSVGDDRFVGDIHTGNNCTSNTVGTFNGGTFDVTAFVRGTCTITNLSDMNFGTTQGGTTPQIDAEARLRANCNDQLPYTIALNQGFVSPTGPRKLALNGTGPGAVRYDLYQNAARTQAWGDGVTAPVYPGTGSGQNQDITVYGRVPSGQTMPARGVYRDTVTATITY